MKQPILLLFGSQSPQAICIRARSVGLGVGSRNEKDQAGIGWGWEGFGFPDFVCASLPSQSILTSALYGATRLRYGRTGGGGPRSAFSELPPAANHPVLPTTCTLQERTLRQKG